MLDSFTQPAEFTDSQASILPHDQPWTKMESSSRNRQHKNLFRTGLS